MRDELDKIHQTSMEILRHTGIRISHGPTRDLIREHGIRCQGDVFYFSEAQLMNWLGLAPRTFTLFARNPKHDLRLGDGRTVFAPGYGCPAVIDADGRKRAAGYDDYCRFLKLVQQSDLLGLNGGLLVQPADLKPEISLPLLICTAIIHSDKCLLGIPGRAADVEKAMALLAAAFEGPEELRRKPRLITLVNTTSPLQLDSIALETMGVCAKYRQPVIISPGPMAGATGPVTLAGNLALGNAEALAAIAIHQMMQPGAPVVYGLQATTADLRTGNIAIGSPGCALQMAYSARLAKRYGLPGRCGGANTDAKAVSPRSGYESMLAMVAACREQPDLMLHGAGILAGYGAMSYEQFIIDLEIIGMVKYYLADIEISAATLALETIHAAGPGGEYLTCRHTLDNCRKVPWHSSLAAGDPTGPDRGPQGIIEEQSRRQLDQMIHTYQLPEMRPGFMDGLTDCLRQMGINPGDYIC